MAKKGGSTKERGKKERKCEEILFEKKAPKMQAFFLAVPESFGGPVFRSRHFFGAACDFVFRLLVPEQKLRLPSAQAFRRKKKIPALSAPGLFHSTM